jgi:hypothetical protein
VHTPPNGEYVVAVDSAEPVMVASRELGEPFPDKIVTVEICIETQRPYILAAITSVIYPIARTIALSHCERESIGWWI